MTKQNETLLWRDYHTVRDTLPASIRKVLSLTETKMDYFSRPIISLSKKNPKDKQETVTPKWLLGTVF